MQWTFRAQFAIERFYRTAYETSSGNAKLNQRKTPYSPKLMKPLREKIIKSDLANISQIKKN